MWGLSRGTPEASLFKAADTAARPGTINSQTAELASKNVLVAEKPDIDRSAPADTDREKRVKLVSADDWDSEEDSRQHNDNNEVQNS